MLFIAFTWSDKIIISVDVVVTDTTKKCLFNHRHRVVVVEQNVPLISKLFSGQT